MTRDRLVMPRKQRALATALGVPPVLVQGDHDVCSTMPGRFLAGLLPALEQATGAARRTA
jgi:hypothetical protein